MSGWAFARMLVLAHVWGWALGFFFLVTATTLADLVGAIL